MTDELHRGLEGVLVAESSLSYVDGDEGRLRYRGYDIEDLARDASYEEVLYLLWHGELPTPALLDSFREEMAAERDLSPDLTDTLGRLADDDEDPMAVLRTATSMLSARDDDADEAPENLPANVRKGRRITAKLPTALATYDRLRRDEAPVDPREDLDHAANFLYMLTGEEPDAVAAETFDMALVLHADHGLNASTFAARVTASTLADLHSAVTSAVGTLSGALHGGANQNVMRMLMEIDESDTDPVKWVRAALAEGRRIPGFGHRVYKVKDPRANILGERSERLAAETGDPKWVDYSRAIEAFMAEEKGLVPNVDFYSASMYYQMGIPISLYTPIFALSRVGGWIAHVLEQWEDNRLIRPRSRYVGAADREFVPVEER